MTKAALDLCHILQSICAGDSDACHWGFGGQQLLYPSDHLSSYLHAELQLGDTKVDVNALSALFVASGFCKSLDPEAKANPAVGNLERN